MKIHRKESLWYGKILALRELIKCWDETLNRSFIDKYPPKLTGYKLRRKFQYFGWFNVLDHELLLLVLIYNIVESRILGKHSGVWLWNRSKINCSVRQIMTRRSDGHHKSCSICWQEFNQTVNNLLLLSR